MHFTYRIARSRVVGVIATKLTVAPSFHWQVIVVFRLEALALSVIATATWLGGWVAG